MHRGARLGPDRSSNTARQQRRAPSASAPTPAPAAGASPSSTPAAPAPGTASASPAGGASGGVSRKRGGGAGHAGPGRPRSGTGRGRGAGTSAKRVVKQSTPTSGKSSGQGPPPLGSPPGPSVSLEEVLPTWKSTREIDYRRSNNVLLALGLQPINKKVARRVLLIERNRMHGIMEGPGEELTVAAVATDGLDGGHHHHHNGGSASLLANGGASPSSKESLPPTSPLNDSLPDKTEDLQEAPADDVSVNEVSAETMLPSDVPKEKSDQNSLCPKAVKNEDCLPSVDANSGEEKKVVDGKESPLPDDNVKPNGDASSSEEVSKQEASELETEKVTKDSGALATATESVNDRPVDVKVEEILPEVEEKILDETPTVENDKEDVNTILPSDEPQLDSSETSCTPQKENSPTSEAEVQMEVEEISVVPSTINPDDVEIKMHGSEDKLVIDTPSVNENQSIVLPQKRSCEENLCEEGEAKKQCLPDIVCNDASALDLSSIRRKEIKEPKIALKPQSLLLSKLQGDSESDKNKQDLHKKENSSSRVIESIRPNKTLLSGTRSDRRRSSREEREKSLHGRRSNDVSNNRIAERDQVLREMRDKVLSSYKERDRVAKEDSLLRDLLEPERDTLFTELVEAATINGGISELERVSAALEADIRVLTVEISNKEVEWNDLIRKRKLKEELALRIHRRKQVLVLTGDVEEEYSRRSSFDGDSRLELKRESQLEARLEGRHDHPEMPPKTGEELLAAALRLGSRNVEDYHHQQRTGGSSPLAVRIQERANELLTGSTTFNERKPSGLLPALSHTQPQSLLQTQLSKPSEISPTSPQSQFLLQHLQRQRVLMGAVSSSGSACRLSSSVSLSAIPTSTTTSSALSTSLPSATTHNKPSSRMDKQISVPGCSRSQRPILPKPSAATVSGGSSPSLVVSDASLDATGGGIIGEGRQGPILDVKSIIADYRSKHPEGVPRRGRRMKTSGMVPENLMSSARPGSSSGGSLLSMSLPALGSGSHVRTGSSTFHADLSELGFVLTPGVGSDGPSRPSSTESTLSGAASQMNQENGSGMSFKDVLVQFAKMTHVNDQSSLSNSTNLLGRGSSSQPHYPEVTLHPVVTSASVSSPTPTASSPTTSLLHGILTKSSAQSAGGVSPSLAKPTTFSPTLARLLTAPERNSNSSGTSHVLPSQVAAVPSFVSGSPSPSYPPTGPVLLSDLLSGGSPSKTRSELTITPVTATSSLSTHIHGLTSSSTRRKQEVVVLDGEDATDVNGDDGDADTDSDERRLIIDEGDNPESNEGLDGDFNSTRLDRARNSVPHCQGCNERDAEFVCAGCQRQWYCSRECQIAAWDEHSEVCFPPSTSTSDS